MSDEHPQLDSVAEGGIPLRSITILEWLDTDGDTVTSYSTTGDPTDRELLAMLQIATFMTGAPIVHERGPR